MNSKIFKEITIAFMVFMLFFSWKNLSAQKKDVFIPNASRQILHGRVTDENGEPLIAQIQVWHYPLTPVVVDYVDSKITGRTDNLISMSYTTEKGFFSVKVPPDTVTVIITKGPEWSLVKERVIIKEKEFNGIEFNVTLKRLYDMGELGWYGGDAHHHTIYSDGYSTPSEVAHAMRGVGLSWGILSDHNSDEGVKEWLGNGTKDFIPVHGCEITTEPSEISIVNGYGHMNQSFIEKMNGKNPLDPNIWARAIFDDHKDVQMMIDLTHEQKGFIAINHPYTSWDWSGRFKSWGKVKDYDAIEVWNGEPPHAETVNDWDTNHINITTWAVQSWFSYLNEGNKITGVAGSDCHDIYGVNAYPKGELYWTTTTGNPRSYVHIEKFSRQNIQSSLSDGKVFLTSTFGPLLLVTVDGKTLGEVVKVEKGGEAKINIEVLANRRLLKTEDGVRIIYNGNIVKKFATDSLYTFEQDISLALEKDGWIVIEAFGQWPMYAITNAVYIDYPPYGDNFSNTWKDPADVEKWNEFLGHPEITLPDGPTNYKDTKDSINKIKKYTN
ncbi:MAG: CehA/McbA family metallohydrolase [Ignavibacteria bacterium]